MKKVIRLTEADLTRLVRRVIKEQGAILPGSQQDITKRAQGKIQSIKNRRFQITQHHLAWKT
jgi:hypothetical protein